MYSYLVVINLHYFKRFFLFSPPLCFTCPVFSTDTPTLSSHTSQRTLTTPLSTPHNLCGVDRRVPQLPQTQPKYFHHPLTLSLLYCMPTFFLCQLSIFLIPSHVTSPSSFIHSFPPFTPTLSHPNFFLYS